MVTFFISKWNRRERASELSGRYYKDCPRRAMGNSSPYRPGSPIHDQWLEAAVTLRRDTYRVLILLSHGVTEHLPANHNFNPQIPLSQS
jgi:hypothetical protein